MRKNNPVTLDPFQNWCHRWGRIGTIFALVYMIALPFVFLSVYGCMPTLAEVLNPAFPGILAIYIPVGFSEALSYTPLMGTSSYLGFIMLGLVGFVILFMLPVAIITSRILWKKGKIVVVDKEI